MIVNDVEQDREPEPVRSVDECAKLVGCPVRCERRVVSHAIVTPAARPVERRDRHELDRRHPELGEKLEPRGRGPIRAFGRESSDVQLVDHVLRERATHRFEPKVEPRLDDHRGAVHAVRQESRVRIRQDVLTDDETIERPVPDAGNIE